MPVLVVGAGPRAGGIGRSLSEGEYNVREGARTAVERHPDSLRCGGLGAQRGCQSAGLQQQVQGVANIRADHVGGEGAVHVQHRALRCAQRDPRAACPQQCPNLDCSSLAWVFASFSVGLKPWDMRPLHHTRQSHSGCSDVEDSASRISILIADVLSCVGCGGVSAEMRRQVGRTIPVYHSGLHAGRDEMVFSRSPQLERQGIQPSGTGAASPSPSSPSRSAQSPS